MNILVVAAECAPFAKVGGLADAVASLAKEWSAIGHTVRIVIPKYGCIDCHRWDIQPTSLLVSVPLGWWQEYTRLWRGYLPETSVPVYFLESHDYFDRVGIYGEQEGYHDNDRRFLFLSRAALEVVSTIDFVPDILHAHDWHTALSLAYLKTQYRYHPRFIHTAGVYTIHNIAFQGQCPPARFLELSNFSQDQYAPIFEHDGVTNLMKAGIVCADKITTVSPTYAYEIRWTNTGMGMQPYIHMRGKDFIGILNGIDTSEWDAENDPLIPAHYSSSSLHRKVLNKEALLHQSMPPYDISPSLPILGMVSRLTEQKGIDLLLGCIERFVQSGKVRFLILGSGNRIYEERLHNLGQRYPTRVMIYTGYNNRLSHVVIASSDYILLPSLFEPCGLTQMYAMRYGTVPIVRSIGGLADTVSEYDPQTLHGTGFTFRDYSVEAFAYAIARGLSYFRHPIHWDQIRRNGMEQDFSARKSALQYLNVFQWARQAIVG